MGNNIRKWSAVFALCIIPLAMNAAEYGVLHLKSVGVSYATTETVASLLANDLTTYGHTVLNPDAMDEAAGEILECYQSECAADAGAIAEVERVIFGSVSTLGEKHIVQVSVVEVATRKVIWAGSLAAKTAEDLDTVVKRLAKSISEGKAADATVEVELVTAEEEKAPMRRRVFHTFGTTAGMVIPVDGYSGTSTLYNLGLLYWYETPSLVAEVAAYGTFPGNFEGGTAAEFCPVEFSLLYMLSKKDISPYFGGGLGFGWLTVETDDPYYDTETAYGITLNAGGGLVFLRTYDIRFIVDARYHINLADIPGADGPHHGFKFSIGLTYRPKFRGCFGCGMGL
ncbi:MAG: hypothetical protein PVH23_05150 [candidate division WOR-3 bacterium]|jgi:hypothetical protein